MGTRSLTYIQDNNGKNLTCIYRQYDGYPDGHGKEIADFLKGRRIVNGFCSEDQGERHNFNGMGCLAAALIKNLKEGIGNIYIHQPDSKDAWEDFRYTIYPGERDMTITKVVIKFKIESSDGTVIYDGLVDEFDAAKLNEEGEA